MGIKNLNKLIKRNPIKNKKLENLIIDGYNIIITLIQSLLSSTRDTVVGTSIIEIFEFLVNSIAYRIKNIIDRSIKNFDVKDIYFIIDGLNQKALIDDNDDIIDIKSSEHEKRESQLNRQKERILESIERNISNIEEQEAEKERRFFEIGENYRLLIHPIIDKVYEIMSNYSFELLESVYEADYTIANLAISLDNSIIMSLDTDFYVMCCDQKNVFIMNFREQYQLYSPYTEWNKILDDCQIEFNKRLIFRLAPLFGNDYTSLENDKQSILSAEDENCLRMIILRDEEVPKRKKKLYLLKSYIDYSSETITIDELDKAIEMFSLNNEKYNDYYEKYKKSIYVYEHLEDYYDFKEYEPHKDGLSKIEQLFPHPRYFMDDTYADLID